MAAKTVDNFTNDSAMMIAYERALETAQGDAALFHDPLAKGAKAAPRDMISTLYTHLETLAGASVSRVAASSTCVYSEIAFDSMPGLAFRYVDNSSPEIHEGNRTLET